MRVAIPGVTARPRRWLTLVSALLAVSLNAITPAAPQAPPPTFTRDVAPILFRHCVTCHHPGTNGAFSLLTYDDVRPRARQIAAVTTSRYMPPGRREHAYGDALVGERRLADDEIDVIQRWAVTGAQGDPAAIPRPPAWTDGWRLGTPDLVIRMPDAY